MLDCERVPHNRDHCIQLCTVRVVVLVVVVSINSGKSRFALYVSERDDPFESRTGSASDTLAVRIERTQYRKWSYLPLARQKLEFFVNTEARLSPLSDKLGRRTRREYKTSDDFSLASRYGLTVRKCRALIHLSYTYQEKPSRVRRNGFGVVLSRISYHVSSAHHLFPRATTSESLPSRRLLAAG